MKARNITKKTESWALPGEPLSLDGFKEGIKKAEEGPFYTIRESKKMLEEWRKKKSSL